MDARTSGFRPASSAKTTVLAVHPASNANDRRAAISTTRCSNIGAVWRSCGSSARPVRLILPWLITRGFPAVRTSRGGASPNASAATKDRAARVVEPCRAPAARRRAARTSIDPVTVCRLGIAGRESHLCGFRWAFAQSTVVIRTTRSWPRARIAEANNRMEIEVSQTMPSRIMINLCVSSTV